MSRKLSAIGEFGLIGLIKRAAPKTSGVVLGIGDDAAVIAKNNREYWLLTADMLVEGVHFTRAMGARRIGRKSLACNISDIAAMGGVPRYALVSLGLRPDDSVKFATDLCQGITRLARKYGIAVIGGDTVRSRKTTISISLMGEVEKKNLLTRRGARTGDKIFVTGRLGRSLASGKHLTFTPRVKEARQLVKFKPSAMIDISDGLAADLGHILKESKKGAVLYADKVPLSTGAALTNALHDGEDFELLFTLPASRVRALARSKQRFYCVGEITGKRECLELIGKKGKKRIAGKGYRHF